MPQYQTPGVYIEEIEIGAKPIEGVSTNVVGFLGETERGPVEPAFITSLDQFKKLFGGYISSSYLTYAIDGYFRNGGASCYVARIAGKDSKKSSYAMPRNSEAAIIVKAVTAGVDGNNIKVKVEDGPNPTTDPLAFKLTVQVQTSTKEYNLSADPAQSNYYQLSNAFNSTFVNLIYNTAGRPANTNDFITLHDGKDETTNNPSTPATSAHVELYAVPSSVEAMTVQAITAGAAGNNIKVKVEDAPNPTTDPLAFKLTVQGQTSTKEYNLSADPAQSNYYQNSGVVADPSVKLIYSTAGRPANTNDFITFHDGKDETTNNPPTPATPASVKLYKYIEVLEVDAIGPGAWGDLLSIIIETATLASEDAELFRLTLNYRESPVEVYDNLSIWSDSIDYFEKRVNGISNYVTLAKIGILGQRPADGTISLTGGSDGNPIKGSDYEGITKDTNLDTGLEALNKISEISLICAPDENKYKGLSDLLISHCEKRKDCFAVLQADLSAGLDINPPTPRSKYAAFYCPWIQIIDPVSNMPKFVPPGGHIAGIYARTDNERGVHKAPANTAVKGAVGLKFNIVDAEQALLNPRGVNCIRSFPGRGILVWGARTTILDASWKYINVRRLFIFVEKSILEGTRWAIFEPNDEKLWSRVKQTIDQFLTTVWRSGALMGTTRDEAFFVRCDRTTMTQDYIDNGRLVVLIGIAPVKPAEFVIFRIAQVAKGSDITEV